MQLLYPASGNSADWALGEAGIRYSYTLELPDTGQYGFILPARLIRSVVEETRDMVAAMLRDLAAIQGQHIPQV